jgi:hypothetical protein
MHAQAEKWTGHYYRLFLSLVHLTGLQENLEHVQMYDYDMGK